MPSKDIDKIRKKLPKIFGEWNLKITVEKEKEQVDYLDVTLCLTEEDYKPYKKPNNRPLYVNTQSNHPPSVIKQIPAGINSRLSAISSNKEHFDNAKQIYQKALNDSGHDYELKFKQPEEKKEKQSKNKKRNIIYYNPSFNLGIKTNIGRSGGICPSCFSDSCRIFLLPLSCTVQGFSGCEFVLWLSGSCNNCMRFSQCFY